MKKKFSKKQNTTLQFVKVLFPVKITFLCLHHSYFVCLNCLSIFFCIETHIDKKKKQHYSRVTYYR